MKQLIRYLALAILGVAFIGTAQAAQDGYTASSASNTSLALCKNIDYALCAATYDCHPTGKKIAVNTPRGGKRSFDEAVCTCPVLNSGNTGAIANLRGGNMQGSCDAPTGTVWSLYSLAKTFPQKNPDTEKWDETDAALNTSCTADLNLGRKYANCFSFKCDNVHTVKNTNGDDVTVADCRCPLGEDVFSALPSKPATAFFTEAGGTWAQPVDACSRYPVGGF